MTSQKDDILKIKTMIQIIINNGGCMNYFDIHPGPLKPPDPTGVRGVINH